MTSFVEVVGRSNKMALKLVCTLLPVFCMSLILQLAISFSIFQSPAEQYHQTTHSSGDASEPDNQTSASRDLRPITESSSAKYGVAKIKEFIDENPSRIQMTKSLENNGIVKRTFGRSNSEAVSSYLLKTLSGNNKVVQQRPSNLLTTLQTDNGETIHLQDKSSNASTLTLDEATTRRNHKRKRKRDMGLLYLFPGTLQDSGSEDNASVDKRNRTHKSRLYLFSNFTLVEIPLHPETNSQSTTRTTATGVSQEKKTSLPKKNNNDEWNRLDNAQNFKKNLYDQLFISKLPTVQHNRRKSALISTLDKNQDKNDLFSYLDKLFGTNESADFWLEKAHKPLPERSSVRRKQDLRSSSLNLVQSDTDDESIVKKFSDSDETPLSTDGMKKTSPEFTDLSSSNVSSQAEEKKKKKKYTLKQRKADRGKASRSMFSKRYDSTFSDRSYEFPPPGGHFAAEDDLYRAFNTFAAINKDEPDDRLLDFIISSNQIKPEEFDIHSMSRRRRGLRSESVDRFGYKE